MSNAEIDQIMAEIGLAGDPPAAPGKRPAAADPAAPAKRLRTEQPQPEQPRDDDEQSPEQPREEEICLEVRINDLVHAGKASKQLLEPLVRRLFELRGCLDDEAITAECAKLMDEQRKANNRESARRSRGRKLEQSLELKRQLERLVPAYEQLMEANKAAMQENAKLRLENEQLQLRLAAGSGQAPPAAGSVEDLFSSFC